MHETDRLDPLRGRSENAACCGVRELGGLQAEQRRDELEAVADAMIDLPQHDRLLGGERLEPVERGAQLLLRGGLLAPQPLLIQCAVDRRREQFQEHALDVLEHVIGGALPQRGDGDARLLRRGHEDDRRHRRHRTQRAQHVKTVATGHVVVERDHVEMLGAGERDPRGPVRRHRDGVPDPFEMLLHQARDSGIVIDVEDTHHVGGREHRHVGSGTCITERNRPSWRIAVAKPS